MFLRDGDGGEGLDFLFVCRRGACVFKLIEELKDKRPECRELGRQAPPLAPKGSEMQGWVTCKSTKAVFFLVPRPPHEAEPHAPTHPSACPVRVTLHPGQLQPWGQRDPSQLRGSHPGAGP